MNLVGPKIRGWTQWSSVFNWLRDRFCDIKTIKDLELRYVIFSLMIKFKRLAEKHKAKVFFVLSPEAMDFRISKMGGGENNTPRGDIKSPFDYDREGLLFFQRKPPPDSVALEGLLKRHRKADRHAGVEL